MFKALTTTTLIAVLAMAATAFVSDQANAGKFRFGNDQQLHSYAKTKMTDGTGTIVDLCYLTETYNVFAPVYTTDKMVLCDTKTERFWEVPTGNKLAELQEAGYLPKPLPDYERPLIDLLFGYLLWIVLGVIALFTVGSKMFRGNKTDDERSDNEPIETRS